MIQSTVGVFGVLAGVGLGLTATKYVAQYRSTDLVQASKFVALSVRLAVLAGLLISSILFFSSAWIARDILGAPGLEYQLRIAAGLIFFGAINGVQMGTMIGLEDFRALAIMNSFRGALHLLCLSIGAWYWGLSGAVTGLVVSEAISAAANQVALRILLRKASIPHWSGRFSQSDISVIMRFAVPALLSSLAAQPGFWYSNVIMVNQPNGYAALGVFTAADKWRQLILFLPTSVASVVLPMLSNLHGMSDTSGFKRIFRANMLVNLAAVLVPSAFLVIFSHFLMSLYGPDYFQGTMTLVILAISATFVVLNNALGQVLVSLGMIWWRFALDVLLGGALILLSLWLIPRYGENGLALATTLAFALTCALLLLIVNSVLKRMK